jgi:hypothetical protein
MNDIDTLQQEVESLRAIVKSLVIKQGLVISSYRQDEVLTPKEEELAREEWLSQMSIASN